MDRSYSSSLTAVVFAALFYIPCPALAQTYLGSNLEKFAVLAGTTVSCDGASTITGDVGVSPGSAIVGFHDPCTIVGALVTPPASDPAQAELVTAFDFLGSLDCFSSQGPDLAGLTLVPGVYCVAAAPSNLTGTLILDAQGDPDAVWVFQMSDSLITSPGSTVSVINGGSDFGVQWQVGSDATIASGTTFVGNILALTSITMDIGANLTGRALARNNQVTLDTNEVTTAGAFIIFDDGFESDDTSA